MTFTHVLHALYCEPWLITEHFHEVLTETVEKHIAGGFKSDELMNLFGGQKAVMSVQDGIADIPVYGVMGRKLSKIEKSCGACDIGELGTNLETALSDPKVKGIMLSMDSPGGSVGGIPEIGAMVAEVAASKPLICFVDGLMASAAYWTGAGAMAIFGTESSVVGSIGVYMRVMDKSRMAENMGIRVELIKAGKFKGAGTPGTSLTEEQRADLQGQVSQIKDMFDVHVSANRPQIDMKTSAQGQVFIGRAAVTAGLMDEVMSKPKAMAYLRQMSGVDMKSKA